ncbi:hypothetical protein ACWIUH_09025 [Ursidibacter arcticus]
MKSMRYGSNDPYIYENGTLKNKLEAKTVEELEDRERDITALRIAFLRYYVAVAQRLSH